MTGIDFSHWQGMIDFYKVVNENTPKIDFSIIKATQGINRIDSMLKYNSIQGNRAGMPISYYHFATLNTTDVIPDGKVQAEFFTKAISNLPKNNFPLSLDIETNKSGLTRDQVLTWINTFLSRLSQLGYEGTYLYSYASFLNANLPVNHNLGNVPLWIASYRNIAQLPAGWTNQTIWQYSATGTINGISGHVDLDRTNNPLF